MHKKKNVVIYNIALAYLLIYYFGLIIVHIRLYSKSNSQISKKRFKNERKKTAKWINLTSTILFYHMVVGFSIILIIFISYCGIYYNIYKYIKVVHW